MFVRAYLRASTTGQDALRAKNMLAEFAAQYSYEIAAYYIENESGAKLYRAELSRLMNDAAIGDVLLVEQIDRLARLKNDEWIALKTQLAEKKICIVSPELPTSWMVFDKNKNDRFTKAILEAVNSMLIDMLAAVARKDYEDRRRRQQEGINNAKKKGRYKGRRIDVKKRENIHKLLEKGLSYNMIQEILGCSRSTISSVSKSIMNEKND